MWGQLHWCSYETVLHTRKCVQWSDQQCNRIMNGISHNWFYVPTFLLTYKVERCQDSWLFLGVSVRVFHEVSRTYNRSSLILRPTDTDRLSHGGFPSVLGLQAWTEWHTSFPGSPACRQEIMWLLSIGTYLIKFWISTPFQYSVPLLNLLYCFGKTEIESNWKHKNSLFQTIVLFLSLWNIYSSLVVHTFTVEEGIRWARKGHSTFKNAKSSTAETGSGSSKGVPSQRQTGLTVQEENVRVTRRLLPKLFCCSSRLSHEVWDFCHLPVTNRDEGILKESVLCPG